MNHIALYHLPTSSPTTVTRISTIDQLPQKAQSLCPGSPLLDNRTFEIESFHVIPPSESKGVHLMAVALNGVRLYFSHGRTGARYGYQSASTSTAPSYLSLIHVRLPPTTLPNPMEAAYPSVNPQTGLPNPPQTWTVAKLGAATYCNGLFLSAQNDEDTSVLLGCAPDIPKIAGFFENNMPAQGGYQPPAQKVLQEFANLLLINGSVWAIAPNPVSKPFSGGLGWNETATQANSPPQSFLVLTNKGLHVVVKRRAVDTLVDLCDQFLKTRDDNPLGLFSST